MRLTITPTIRIACSFGLTCRRTSYLSKYVFCSSAGPSPLPSPPLPSPPPSPSPLPGLLPAPHSTSRRRKQTNSRGQLFREIILYLQWPQTSDKQADRARRLLESVSTTLQQGLQPSKPGTTQMNPRALHLLEEAALLPTLAKRGSPKKKPTAAPKKPETVAQPAATRSTAKTEPPTVPTETESVAAEDKTLQQPQAQSAPQGRSGRVTRSGATLRAASVEAAPPATPNPKVCKT